MKQNEAIKKLNELFMRTIDGQEFVLLIPADAKEISELIEQQAQEIAKLKEINVKQRVHIHRRCDECPNRMDSFKQHIDLTDKVFELGQEIAQLNAQLQEQEKFVQVQAQEIERLKSKCESLQKGFDLNG